MAPTALVVGEALIDEYPGERVVAGAPLHVAAHIAALGWQAMLVTRVGRDPDGERIVTACHRLGIDTTLVETDPTLPTGTTAITLTGPGHRFDVRYPAAWDEIHGPDVVPSHDALVFGSLALRHPTAAATVRRLVAASTGLIVFDANLRPPHVDPVALAWAVGTADVLKMNHEEAAAVGTHPAGPTWVCITRGADGASLSHRDGRSWNVSGIRTPVVDTVGAGDAFLAALVHGLVTGDDPGATLAAANRAGADVVSRRGGLPGTVADGAARAEITEVEFLYLESLPVQVRAVVTGNLPTPCHQVAHTAPSTPADGKVLVEVTVTPPTEGVVCAQVIEPFEITIDLGSFAPGDWTLELNGTDYGFTV